FRDDRRDEFRGPAVQHQVEVLLDALESFAQVGLILRSRGGRPCSQKSQPQTGEPGTAERQVHQGVRKSFAWQCLSHLELSLTGGTRSVVESARQQPGPT